ncbi:aminomethyl-transferring glycine dehydrogenase subunit GcvPA [Eubacteriales bacterium OttesenSCG-928-N13]|nr:aminomethyl-transferring glycine dehydrogenase subunit GcvPA [Eubacteriales bacterium OttesenSCG-928-N13]
MGSYIPSSAAERSQMLGAIGLESMRDLYQAVPEQMLVSSLDLPEGASELEVIRLMQAYAGENRVFDSIFRGAGAYHHYIPSIVKSVIAKEDFLTAYTPYQAEISQGILQSIFEYQTMIAELTGMDASNASVYDGASAAAEALTMCRDKKRTSALVASTIQPMVMSTIQTYSDGADAEVIRVPELDGRMDIEALKSLLHDGVASVYFQQPNYYGLFEDAQAIIEIAHQAGAKVIMGVNPIALALMATPGELGADIAVGEGQPLGLPLAFGGPYLGFMATRMAMVRRLPGRIVGETVDVDGKRAFVLTLQAREQHIRREKAQSNICSNQALCAMAASVYAAAMGRDGLIEVANQCHSKAVYLNQAICALPGFEVVHEGEFFHEFVTRCPIDAQLLMQKLEQRGILGGLPLDDGNILWCATEMNTKAQMDQLVDALKEVAR